MVDTTPQRQLLPPLENGDRLTRYEFERRYNAMPHLKKAELIEGVVYIPAQRRCFRSHAQPHAHLVGWIGYFAAFTAGMLVGAEPTVRLDLDNEPQPDAVLLIEAQYGGQVRLSEDDYIEGWPIQAIAPIAKLTPATSSRVARQ